MILVQYHTVLFMPLHLASHKLWSLPFGVSLHLLDASWYLPETARKDAAVRYGLTTKGTTTPSDKETSRKQLSTLDSACQNIPLN